MEFAHAWMAFTVKVHNNASNALQVFSARLAKSKNVRRERHPMPRAVKTSTAISQSAPRENIWHQELAFAKSAKSGFSALRTKCMLVLRMPARCTQTALLYTNAAA
tara:strand:- start:273 stop:590 length:318 start_codon:yes stop_codon:yes gene_type:complete